MYVNRSITGAGVGRQPFGGYGLSGVGSKAGGPDYLLQFVDPRVVTENTLRQGFTPDASTLSSARSAPGRVVQAPWPRRRPLTSSARIWIQVPPTTFGAHGSRSNSSRRATSSGSSTRS